MKSNKNTRAVIVGIFIFVALTIFIVGVLAFGGQRKGFADTVDVKTVFDDVNGLQKGGNVWLAGVKVGTINSIRFNNTGGVDVELGIEESARAYVHKDTRAKLGTDGLIGNKIIVLYGGSAQSPTIQDGDLLQVEKVIAMDDVMGTLQANNKNILEITNDFKTIAHRVVEGQGSLGKILKEETLADDLHGVLASLQRASRNAEVMTQSMSSYTARLQQPGSLTNDILTDTVLFSKLRSSVTQIEQVTQTANEVMLTMKSATTSLNADLNRNNTPAGVLLRDEETAVNLKAAIRNLQTSTEKLDENMEALQHNFLLRGFFKKKAKEEKAQGVH